jgi:hypothetical protein
MHLKRSLRLISSCQRNNKIAQVNALMLFFDNAKTYANCQKIMAILESYLCLKAARPAPSPITAAAKTKAIETLFLVLPLSVELFSGIVESFVVPALVSLLDPFASSRLPNTFSVLSALTSTTSLL